MPHRPADRNLTPPLYEQLRDRLFARVLEGAYPDGSFLPTEAELGKTFRMSRVTVRRALQALKQEGVIAAVAGQGTRVTYLNNGHAGNLQLIALVADFQSDFFTHFMHRFEAIAEARGAVVMLKTDRSGATFTADTLLQKLARAGIRDMVLWPLTADLDDALYARLRAVGVNLVVFDQQLDVPWADVVGIDNRAAIAGLLAALKKQGCRRPAMLTYSNQVTPTVSARLRAFAVECSALGLTGGIHEVLYHPDPANLEAQVAAEVDRLQAAPGGAAPDGWIGVNGGVGLALGHVLRSREAAHGKPARRKAAPIATIDCLPEMTGLRLHAVEQPMAAMAQAVFDSLLRQHKQAARWQARQILIPGRQLLT